MELPSNFPYKILSPHPQPSTHPLTVRSFRDLPKETWVAERRCLKSDASSSIGPHTPQTPTLSVQKNFPATVIKVDCSHTLKESNFPFLLSMEDDYEEDGRC